MDRSRKATRNDNEVTLQHRSQQDALLSEELAEENLTQLRTSIDQLRNTSEGFAMLQKRAKVFGECNRIEGETSGRFYARLRNWLEREIPQSKSPLHPPRQTGG